MIHYLVTAAHRYTADWFLECAPWMADRLAVLPYEEAVSARSLPNGTYVFSDLERLSGKGLGDAIELWDRLARRGRRTTLLNDPSRVPRRYELLRRLHASGVNDFTGYRMSELSTAEPRFPVFIREAREHTKSLTALLYGWEEVRAAAGELGTRHGPDELLLVEWCDTSDADGVFRKYGAFVVGDTIVPRSLMCARQWVVQDYELFDEVYMQEARDYLAENPHADLLLNIARENHIDYGRFDYAFVDGRLQVWELNTNPCVITPPPEDEIGELHAGPLQWVSAALTALDAAPRRRAGGLIRRLRPSLVR